MDERIVDYIPMTEKRREKWDKRNLIAVKCPKCKTRFVLNRKDADNYSTKNEVACPECGFTHYHWSSYTTPNFMYNISKFIRSEFYEDDC